MPDHAQSTLGNINRIQTTLKYNELMNVYIIYYSCNEILMHTQFVCFSVVV